MNDRIHLCGVSRPSAHCLHAVPILSTDWAVSLHPSLAIQGSSVLMSPFEKSMVVDSMRIQFLSAFSCLNFMALVRNVPPRRRTSSPWQVMLFKLLRVSGVVT
eukprot:2724335-Pleurochrysis_carterae.AAC.2